MTRSTKIKGKIIAQDSVEFSGLTAGTVPVLDSNKQIISSVVTPSELTNLSGTTAPIQDQLDDENNRVTGLEESSKILKLHAYQDNQLVWGSAQPPTKDPLTNILGQKLERDGWYFQNAAGQQIAWYFFDGSTQAIIEQQNFSCYTVITLDVLTSKPIFGIYSFPTGVDDVLEGFAHSRWSYQISTANLATMVAGKKYLLYVGENPSCHPEIEHIPLTFSAFASGGELLPDEIVFTSGLISESTEPAGEVKWMVESLGVWSPDYKHELSLRFKKAYETDVQIALNLKIDKSKEAQPNGIATLDGTGKVPSSQLPSYVDDVLEFANLAAFPNPGSTGIIYLALDTSLIYRWSGSTYAEISPSQALIWGGISGTLSNQTDLQNALDGKADTSHTQGLSTLTQSGALVGQVPVWNGTAWSPAVPVGTTTWGSITGTLSNQTDLQSALDAKQGSLGFTPENVANKSTDIALGTSDTLYPSQKAVKTYVDTFVASSSPVTSVNGQSGPVVLDSDDLANQQSNPDYWDIADGSTIKAHLDELAARREAQNTLTKEPTGFATRDESTTSFNDSAPDRTFTIAPVGASFTFYVKGVKFTKTTSESIQIPNLSGNHYIYYNPSGVLSTTQVASSDLFKENAFVSVVYWNTDTSTHSYFAEERHGLQMDGETHSYLHTVLGAQYLSGLALQNFVVNGDGSLATHAQFTADEGSIRDEDLLLTLIAQTQIPVLFRQGSLWRKKTADSFPVIYSGTAGYTGASGRLPYNQLISGSWQLTEIGNNAFVLIHVFATNDKETPIVAVQGIAEYGNVTAARIAASSEITSLSGLPFAEFVALGSVVFESSNTYTNTPKAITRSINGGSYVDFRGTQLYTAAGVATNHSLLSGLAGDDHIQYHTDARGDARYYTKAQVDALVGGGGSSGDISEQSYSFSNSQIIPEDITGLIFAAASVRSFDALVSVSIDATSDLFETFELSGVNKSGSFSMSVTSVGDDSGVVFSITSTGQVQYTSSNYSGFVSGTIKFRAITTTV